MDTVNDPRPAVTFPRATAADDAVQPDWDDMLTITVGQKDADIVGTTDRAIQAAVDYCKNMGGVAGGTVKILPGTYHFDNCVQLRSGTRIVGSGSETILMKNPSHICELGDESDWNDQEITFAEGHKFNVGDGVCLRAMNPHYEKPMVLYRTLLARKGNRFKVDQPLMDNFWFDGKPTAAALFPLIRGEKITDCVIENITLDGNRDNNEHLDGNYAGCIWLQECARIHINRVEARNYNGDGLSWQVAHDVIVENCYIHNNKDLGMHPGSGAQRPLIQDNRIENCGTGIFFCWGVKFGLAQNNKITNCDKGISIGHRDNDNIVRNNEVTASREVGVLFRPERGKNYAPHRNTFENNRIIDCGSGDDSVAVDVQGEVDKVNLIGNEIRDTRGKANRVGVKLNEKVGDIHMESNTIEGIATDVLDLRE